MNRKLSGGHAMAAIKLLGVLALTASWTSIAAAQEAEAGSSGATVTEAGEIVVTARKKSERLSEVSASISAFDVGKLQQNRVENVNGLANIVPNMTFSNDQEAAVSTMTIRAVSQVRNGEPPVAFVIDGVPLANSLIANQDFVDIAQVEVLRGPQGALYGRNAIGGAINIVTKQPGESLEGQVKASLAEGNDYGISTTLSGPIIPGKLYFSAGGKVSTRQGQLKNIALDKYVDYRDVAAARLRLLYKASDDFSVDLRLSANRTRQGAAYFIAKDRTVLSPGPDGSPTGPNAINNNSVTASYFKFFSPSLKLEWDTNIGKFISITGYDWIDAPDGDTDNPRENYDVDVEPGALVQVGVKDRSETYTQEFRWVTPKMGIFQGVTGLFYQKQKRDRAIAIYINTNFDGVNYADAANANWLYVGSNVQNLRNSAWGAFGSYDFEFVPKLTLTLAGRYDEDAKKDLIILATDPGGRRTFKAFQPRVSLAYKPHANSVIYATFAKGFRSGGFNNTATFDRSYEPEKLDSYEIGYKDQFFDNRLAVSFAVYDYEYKNLQTFLFAPDGSQGIVNVDKSRARGFEADVNARLIDNLQLGASFAYNHTKVTALRTSSGAVVLDRLYLAGQLPLPAAGYEGNKLKTIPKYTLNLSATFDQDLSDSVKFFSTVNYRLTGKTYWELTNRTSRPAYGLVDLSLGLEMGSVKLMAFAQNLFDKKYEVFAFEKEPIGNLSDIYWPSKPRQFGVELTTKF